MTKKQAEELARHPQLERYQLTVGDGCIRVHKPAFINVRYRKLKVRESDIVVEIENSKVAVTMWKDTELLHTTVFP